MNTGNTLTCKFAHLLMALTVTCGAVGTTIVSAPSAMAADCSPEVESTVWEENNQECATVTVNGKEIITFRGENAQGSAEDRAEKLADKLQDVLKDAKFDLSKMLPGAESNQSSIRMDGSTLIRFEIANNDDTAMEQSFKVVNNIRTILGQAPVPAAFLKAVETQSPEQAMAACLGRTIAPSNFVANFSGHASWYGGRFHGRKTSNGDRFDQDGFTAAHRSLPFGTKLLVLNRRTGDSCVVEVNDRGPFIEDRVIDLSRGAAQKLNMLSSGVAMVDCMVINNNDN